MDSFALVQSSRFSTTDRWSWRITALAFPMRISNSLFCLPSLVNETPRYLNFSDCFSGTPSICREHCFGCLDRHMVSVFVELIFIPATEHAFELFLTSTSLIAQLNYIASYQIMSNSCDIKIILFSGLLVSASSIFFGNDSPLD